MPKSRLGRSVAFASPTCCHRVAVNWFTFGSPLNGVLTSTSLPNVLNNPIRERATARPVLVRVSGELPGDVVSHVQLLPRPRVGDFLALREGLFHDPVHPLDRKSTRLYSSHLG